MKHRTLCDPESIQNHYNSFLAKMLPLAKAKKRLLFCLLYYYFYNHSIITMDYLNQNCLKKIFKELISFYNSLSLPAFRCQVH